MALVCAALHAAPAGDAVMYRGNPSLTGVVAATSADAVEGLAYTFQAGGPIRSAPMVYDGLLYFGSGDGVFHALDAKSGIERWHVVTGGAITSSPAAAAGRIYVASRDGYLYCLGARDGSLRWRHRFGADLGLQNYCLVGTICGRLEGIDAVFDKSRRVSPDRLRRCGAT